MARDGGSWIGVAGWHAGKQRAAGSEGVQPLAGGTGPGMDPGAVDRKPSAAIGASSRRYKSQVTFKDMAKAAVASEFKEVWEDTLNAAMGPGYYKVASIHMGQIRLMVFARNDIYASITSVRTAKQATGVAGVATNKGGVSVSLKVWDTKLVFINAHLAAHQDKAQARNAMYRDIVRGLRPDTAADQGMDVLTTYHHAIWMGDLNYRLDYGAQASTMSSSPTLQDHQALVGDIEKERWEALLASDQLRTEMGARRAFLGFNEAPIAFAPTFKVARTRGFAYQKQRSPAWCDRILYRSNLPLKQVRPVSYFTAPDIATSDHKPVAAILTVPTVWRTAAAAEEATLLASAAEGAGGVLALALGGSRAGGTQAAPQVSDMRLVFTRLRIRGLLMGRARRASITSAQVPNPQLVFQAPCMAAPGILRTTIRKATRDPWWCSPPPATPQTQASGDTAAAAAAASATSPQVLASSSSLTLPRSPSHASMQKLQRMQSVSAKALGAFLRQVSGLPPHSNRDKDKDKASAPSGAEGRPAGGNAGQPASSPTARHSAHVRDARAPDQSRVSLGLEAPKGIAAFIATHGKPHLAGSAGGSTAGAGAGSAGGSTAGTGAGSAGGPLFPSWQPMQSTEVEMSVANSIVTLTDDGNTSVISTDDAGPGMYSIPLRKAAFSEMAHFRLWVRVMDHQSGATGTLARGALPLTDAVTRLLAGAGSPSTPFRLQLELNGLPAGELEGEMMLVANASHANTSPGAQAAGSVHGGTAASGSQGPTTATLADSGPRVLMNDLGRSVSQQDDYARSRRGGSGLGRWLGGLLHQRRPPPQARSEVQGAADSVPGWLKIRKRKFLGIF